jgi:dolichyl-diphosphooligosaccharide--protein glycosyltransferase
MLRQGGRYVVINQQSGSPGATYDALFNGFGVGYNDTQPTGRYQPVYVGDEVRAFTVVEGAVLNVTGANGEEIVATTDVEVGGETVTYERRGVIEDGSVELRLAHPGEYTVGGQTVTVSTASVYDGERMPIDT